MTTTRYVLANLRRNRLRNALTGAAIMFAVMLVTLLLTMPAGLEAMIDRLASNTRISVHNKAGLVYSMPFSFAAKVRKVDGVAAAMGITWFGGTYEDDGKLTFPNFAVEVDQIDAVYPDYQIERQALADMRRYRDGALVGRMTLRKYGWKRGDRITLKSTVWPVALDFRIVGEIPVDQSPLLWFDREYLDQALRAAGRPGLGIIGMIWVRAEEATRVNDIMRTIDAMSRNSDAETASETEKTFVSTFFGTLQGFVALLLVVTGLVTICLVFIAGNTASMTIRERAAEIAVLKAIGFGRRRIFTALLVESVALSAVAGVVGVALAAAVTGALRSAASGSPALGPLGAFTVTPAVIARGLILSFVVGVVAAIVPALGAARKPVAESLHEVF
jgi:putative ABC transport system permease protein